MHNWSSLAFLVILYIRGDFLSTEAKYKWLLACQFSARFVLLCTCLRAGITKRTVLLLAPPAENSSCCLALFYYYLMSPTPSPSASCSTPPTLWKEGRPIRKKADYGCLLCSKACATLPNENT